MELSLRKCVHYIARFWWILVIVTVLGGVIGFVLSTFDSGVYQATGTIKIVYGENVDQNSEGYSTFRATTIANVIEDIKNRTFLTKQFDNAGAQELYTTKNSGSGGKDVLDYISVEQNGISDFITISCRTENKDFSLGIMSGILTEIPTRIDNNEYSCVVTSEAKLSDEVTPPWMTSMLMGLAIGLIAGVVILVIARAFDTRILEECDITDNFEIELLGNLSEVKK